MMLHKKQMYKELALLVMIVVVSGAAVGAESEEMALLRRTSQAFTQVAKQAVPAVVAVQSEHVITASGGFYGSPFDDDFFERFFGPRFRSRSPREERHIGQGSGFIISEDGYILTNNHVVAGADKITIIMNDGGKYDDVEVVGSDEKSDVALLKIKDVKNLPTVKLGNSDKLEIGEWVIAVGNPFGLTETVTVGVVSAKGRKLHEDGSDVYEDFIQTDAAINPGNSGGPLLNIDGEVVGLNAAIITGNDRGYMGIGLAVPINMAKNIKDQLIETGKVTRGYAGFVPQDLTEELAKAFDLEIRRGAIVTYVEEDSPADKAGLKVQDIIVEIDGRKIDSAQDARNIIGFAAPGTELTIVINRDGREKKLKLTTGTRPVTDELIEKLGIEIGDTDDGQGVVITGVKESSEAARVGLRPDMLILSLNRERVNSVKEFMDVLEKAEGSRQVALFVKNRQYTYYVVLPLEE